MRESHADLLIDFLHHNTAPTIYIVGDLFDFWAINRQERMWPYVYTDLIRNLRAKVVSGTQIYYLVGNHDEFMYTCVGVYGNLEIADKIIHTTLTGRKLLVMHGHQVDFVHKKMHWLEVIGDYLYDWALIFNHKLAKIRKKYGYSYWSISAFAKRQIKGVLTYIEGFEDALEEEAKKHGCTGVICGHIHTPNISVDKDFLYINCGDWVESMSAIVETEDGYFNLITWGDEKHK